MSTKWLRLKQHWKHQLASVPLAQTFALDLAATGMQMFAPEH
jgi:hypothetical protein